MFYNESFEKAILSSIIFEPSMFSDMQDRLHSHHFYFPPHQDIYNAILSLTKNDKPIDEGFILKECGGKHEREMGHILTVNPISSVAPYITEVIEMWAKREIRRLSTVIMQSVDGGKSSEMIVSEIQRYVESIEFNEESRARSFSHLKAEFISRSEKPPVYKTGVEFIDDPLNGGFKMGQLVLVSGEPEAGKTILTMQMLKNVSAHNPAVLFAFEFTTDNLVELQIDSEGEEYENHNLQIIDDGFDIMDIEREIKAWAKRGTKFFVIDSQMRIENASNTGTMEDRESEKFSRLAKLSHKLKIVVMLVIQNSKTDAAANVISPMGSKKGAHEATIIMHLKRVKDDKNTGRKEVRELVMSKNKQTGIHFKGEIQFDPYKKRFIPMGAKFEKVEYKSKKKHSNNIPVEHQDKNGTKTGSSTMTRTDSMMADVEQSDLFEMPVL